MCIVIEAAATAVNVVVTLFGGYWSIRPLNITLLLQLVSEYERTTLRRKEIGILVRKSRTS